MKCNKCGAYAETVADIRNCVGSEGCGDGTGRQIPGDLPGDTPISAVFGTVPGLANRFIPGSAPVAVVEEEASLPSDGPTKEGMEQAIGRLATGEYTKADKDYVTGGMRAYYGELFDEDAERRAVETLPDAPADPKERRAEQRRRASSPDDVLPDGGERRVGGERRTIVDVAATTSTTAPGSDTTQ